jgi:hypothetical protein
MDRIHYPNSYSDVEIFRDERLPFGIYSGKNYKTYCQTVANRCIKFERNGTGLANPFKDLISEGRTKYADLIASLKQAEPEDDSGDGEDYENYGADDISLNDEMETLSRLFQKATVSSACRSSDPNSAKPMKEVVLDHATIHQMIANQNTPKKPLALLSDDRIMAAWKLDDNWDGEIYITENGMSVMEDTEYHKDLYFSAHMLMSNTGLSDTNDVFIVDQQIQLDNTHNRL